MPVILAVTGNWTVVLNRRLCSHIFIRFRVAWLWSMDYVSKMVRTRGTPLHHPPSTGEWNWKSIKSPPWCWLALSSPFPTKYAYPVTVTPPPNTNWGRRSPTHQIQIGNTPISITANPIETTAQTHITYKEGEGDTDQKLRRRKIWDNVGSDWREECTLRAALRPGGRAGGGRPRVVRRRGHLGVLLRRAQPPWAPPRAGAPPPPHPRPLLRPLRLLLWHPRRRTRLYTPCRRVAGGGGPHPPPLDSSSLQSSLFVRIWRWWLRRLIKVSLSIHARIHIFFSICSIN